MFEGSGKGVGESEDTIIPIEETLSNHALNASRNTVTNRLAESSRIDIFVLFTVIGMPPNGLVHGRRHAVPRSAWFAVQISGTNVTLPVLPWSNETYAAAASLSAHLWVISRLGSKPFSMARRMSS